MSDPGEYLALILEDQPGKKRRPDPAPLSEDAAAIAKSARTKRQMPTQKRRLIQWLADTYGPELQAEYRFHATRYWRFDWALPAIKVAIEFDGVVGGKAHTSIQNVLNDSEKQNEAVLAGWMVIRVNTPSLRGGDGYRYIEQAVALRRQ